MQTTVEAENHDVVIGADDGNYSFMPHTPRVKKPSLIVLISLSIHSIVT